MKNRIGALLLALPLTAGGLSLFGMRTKASAESAPSYWSGANGSGVVAVYEGGECPVEVKRETLTFSITDLPLVSFDGYNSTVTAEYELYNPTPRDVTLSLFFPLGLRPSYYETYQEEGAILPGAEAYSVTVERGGKTQAAEIDFRRTYYGGGYSTDPFNVVEQIPMDTFIENGMYDRGMRVTRYSYTVTAPSDGIYYTFCFIYDCNPRKTQVICESGVTGTIDGRGIAYAFLTAGETREVTFYAVGEQLTSGNLDTKLCVGWGTTSEEARGGTVSVLTETRQTFADFVEDFRPKEETEFGCVSEMDWYNAVVAMLSSGESGKLFLSDDLQLLDYLMLWCEYSLTIPAGGTVINTVTAPVYPAIEGSAPRYTYDYMLSPAQYWADFGTITIRIETEYRLCNSSLPFAQTETGYVYTKSSLPMGDLSFSVAKTDYTGSTYDPYDDPSPTIITALILLGAVIVIAVVIVIVAVRIHKRNTQQLIRQQERLERGRAQEGHIDLPEEPSAGGNPADADRGKDGDNNGDNK